MEMFFGKKEDKAELPDLPPLPDLPSRNASAEQKPAMPSFPDVPSGEGAAMGASGRAFQGGDELARGPEMNKTKVMEMEEWHPQNPQFGEPGPEMREHPELHESSERDVGGGSMMPEPPEEETPPELENLPEPRKMYVQKKPSPMTAVQPQQQADVFVRIDKFHSARRSLHEIQNRLEDIDELIKRIRDTKMKEEQELAGWEKDLMQVKSRMQTVTENIFEKVE